MSVGKAMAPEFYACVEDGRLAEDPKESVAEYIVRSTTEQVFEKNVEDVFSEAQALLLKKHNDYGPGNISRAPGGALNGIRVRLHDKFARIDHLTDSGRDPQNESVRDSWIDAMNYCAIALMVIDGAWPDA